MRGLALTACSVIVLACADGSGGARVERCAPLAGLAPLPSQQCSEEARALAFEQSLRDSIEDAAGGLLVRVQLGDDARVRTLCADGASGHWKARRALGGRLAALMENPAGPACLAGKRLDLNRRAAKLAEIDRVEYRCEERLRTTLDRRHVSVMQSFLYRQRDECMEHEATWIRLTRRGVMQPHLFGKPEIVDPPSVRAPDMARRCSRKNDVDAQIACIEAEGWELLD